LWAVLKGRRVDSLKEIRDYRARREEEDRRVMEALRKGKGHDLLEDRSFFERLKDVFSRRRKKR
jgi:SOS response regulatory protein OraA/RecX